MHASSLYFDSAGVRTHACRRVRVPPIDRRAYVLAFCAKREEKEGEKKKKETKKTSRSIGGDVKKAKHLRPAVMIIGLGVTSRQG